MVLPFAVSQGERCKSTTLTLKGCENGGREFREFKEFRDMT